MTEKFCEDWALLYRRAYRWGYRFGLKLSGVDKEEADHWINIVIIITILFWLRYRAQFIVGALIFAAALLSKHWGVE